MILKSAIIISDKKNFLIHDRKTPRKRIGFTYTANSFAQVYEKGIRAKQKGLATDRQRVELVEGVA